MQDVNKDKTIADDFFNRMLDMVPTHRKLKEAPIKLTAAQQTIYDDLSTDKISWEEAAKLLEASPITWHTKEWKVNREKVIKTFCEQCGNTEGVMVIQHPYHPPSISDLINRLAGNTEPDIQPFIDNAKEQLAEQYALIQPEQRESCPKCGSTSIRWHKTTQKWNCKSYTGQSWCRRSECKNVFTEPSYVQAHTPASKKAITALNGIAYQEAQKAYWVARLEWWAEVSSRHGKAAVLESLRWSSWYLSMKETQTFCKKCAFKADKHIVDAKRMMWSE